MTRRGFWKRALLAHGVLLLSGGASADMVTLEFSVSFGETPADGPSPWLTAVFDDEGSPGSVNLSITAAPTLGDADVTELYFNLDPTSGIDPGDLVFTEVDTAAVGAVVIQAGTDAYQAGGDGSYDIWFDIPTGDEALRLNAGETIEFTITAADLTAMDFYDLSAPGEGEGNPGPFLAAAHIQSTGVDQLGSDWVAAVPIPAAIWLFASSLGMLGYAARRRRHSLAAA